MKHRNFALALSLLLLAALLFPSSASCAVRERGTLRVGIRPSSPPFSFLALRDGKKTVRGYAVDQCSLLAKALGMRVEFVPVDDMEERREMLQAGVIDLIAYDAEPPAGLHEYFLPMGFNLRHHLYVNRRCSSVTCLRDLQDKRTVVIHAAPYALQDLGRSGSSMVHVNSPLEALSMLDQGVVDVFLAPSERTADFLIDSNGFQNILKKGIVLGEAPLGIIMDARSLELVRTVQAMVDAQRREGLLDRLNEKWFGRAVGGLSIKRYYRHFVVAAAVLVALFVAFTLWNVSLKRRVEAVTRDLRRTEQRYRDLIESSPDMIFLVEESGSILHANERARSTLELPPLSERTNFAQLVVPEDVPDVAAFLSKVYHDGCDKYEFVLREPGGQLMEVEIAGRVIQGNTGADLQACLFARNVTERNRMEAELIQSERLGIIGKMAASLAHEINNPLGIIQANAEDLLFVEELSVETRQGLEAIRRNAVRAGEITTGLLDLASPKPLRRDELNLEELVRESVALLGPKLKKLTLSLQFPEQPLLVRGDFRSLQQVVVNLLLNAQESIDGEGRVTIAARADGGAPGTVRLVILDTGRGIPRKDLANIFEPFFTSRKTGFGLGLFITRRIVEGHGGIIFAESEPGEGTRMIIELPALHESQGA